MTKDKLGLVGAVTNRAEAQAIRLSMIYALLDGKKFIEPQHLEPALALWRYCEASANYIFASRIYNHDARIIVRALEDGAKSTTDLYGSFSRKIKRNDLEKALYELIGQGKILSKKVSNGGKPKYF